MKTIIWSMMFALLIGAVGCLNANKEPNTVRPAKPDDPNEEVPSSVSKLMPEEITAENYKVKVKQFEVQLIREREASESAALSKKKASQE
jgi:hypothetical protein